MIFCPKCGKQLADDAKFCDGCGNKVYEEPNTSSSAPVSVQAPVNTNAAVQTAQNPEPAAAVQNMSFQAVQQPAAAAVKKPFPKKAVLFGSIGIAAVAVIIIIIVLISNAGSSSDGTYPMYFKSDGQLYYNKLTGGDPWQITEKLGAPSNSNLYEAASQIAGVITMSKDGKTIFYPDRIGSVSNGMTLYCRSFNSDDEGMRIDTDIIKYTVNDSADTVTYIKYGDNNLYQYSLNSDEKNKISSDVSNFYVTDDGGRIVYSTKEYGIYYYSTESGDKEKIDSDSVIKYCSDDLKTVYYTKNADNDDPADYTTRYDLYKKVDGEEKVKIASNIFDVTKFYDDGSMYYIKHPEESNAFLMDYVEDDLKDSDALITEPTYPEREQYPDYPQYPFRYQYDSTEEYEAARDKYDDDYKKYQEEVERINNKYNEDREKYLEDFDKYWEKQSRDSLRESLKSSTVTNSSYILCYYNGTEEKVVNSTYSSCYSFAMDSAAIAFSAYDMTNMSKVKLSEISYSYEVQEKVEEALSASLNYYAAVGETATAFGESKADTAGVMPTGIMISDDAANLYYIVREDTSDSYGELFCASIVDGVVQGAESYDTYVSTYSNNYYSCLRLLENGDLAYMKDFKDNKGDLYINKERVDYDVEDGLNGIQYVENTGSVIYLTDVSTSGKGTMKIYHDGSAEIISDDVAGAQVLTNGNILYLYDYSTIRYRGELYIYRNGKTEKVDEDVVAIAKISDSKYKAIYNNGY